MIFSFKVFKDLLWITNLLVTRLSSKTYSFKDLSWLSNKSSLHVLIEFKNTQATVYFFSKEMQLISLKSHFCISKCSKAKCILDK